MTVPRVNHPWRESPLKGRETRQGHRTEYPLDFPVTVSLSRSHGPVPVRSGVRAADLIASERCSAPCLLACEDGECGCRCAGEFHGALADADVTIDPANWHLGAALRVAGEGAPDGRVSREDLRALPFGAPAATLRLRIAMLAWDCGAREAARRLGMARTTMYHAMAPWVKQEKGKRP